MFDTHGGGIALSLLLRWGVDALNRVLSLWREAGRGRGEVTIATRKVVAGIPRCHGHGSAYLGTQAFNVRSTYSSSSLLRLVIVDCSRVICEAQITIRRLPSNDDTGSLLLPPPHVSVLLYRGIVDLWGFPRP